MTHKRERTWLDPDGGWRVECACGWRPKFPCFYKKAAQALHKDHVQGKPERHRWGALPLGEEPPK